MKIRLCRVNAKTPARIASEISSPLRARPAVVPSTSTFPVLIFRARNQGKPPQHRSRVCGKGSGRTARHDCAVPTAASTIAAVSITLNQRRFPEPRALDFSCISLSEHKCARCLLPFRKLSSRHYVSGKTWGVLRSVETAMKRAVPFARTSVGANQLQSTSASEPCHVSSSPSMFAAANRRIA